MRLERAREMERKWRMREGERERAWITHMFFLQNQNITTELVALTVVSYIGCGISIACLLVAIVFFLTLG